ncbi:hypothetical protein [Micromonospora sp. WMMD1082]|uniref:hypothetical protein n=1 Tax=Micromonospora sp. WMMD1082 TaxID=3016104 RepID=UPI0024166E6C|nr:hypothetical protein [Micromonospora sp. WMMD1082]MDG4795045.1 hypothetical protein [Micromonospora sp. WMMD1082]
MDDTFLQRAAGAAGYRFVPERLPYTAVTQPEHVAQWIAAAGRYAATNALRRLLADAMQTLRDRLARTPLAPLTADLDALDTVARLLIALDDDFDTAMRDLGRHGAALAELDLPALVDDSAVTSRPAAMAQRQETHDRTDSTPARRGKQHAGNPLPPSRRRRRPRR